MKRAILFLTVCLTYGSVAAGGGEPAPGISVLDGDVLCIRATRLIQKLASTNHLTGIVLDLRFAEAANTNAVDYLKEQKLPLVVLVNGQTRGAAAVLAGQLRAGTNAIIIGSTNSSPALAPDILVAVSTEDERKFQDNPMFNPSDAGWDNLPTTNSLSAFIDRTSEAELVRKRIKDGEGDGETSTPRAEPLQPVIRDPALARAVDLIKALAVLHPARG